MKTGIIEKQSTAIMPEDLSKINAYTRRDHTVEDLYSFPLTLCDNEIDRDRERFSIPALHKLADLFLGKTGVFDHKPCASGQTARIYDTEVVSDVKRKTTAGEPYTKLTAKAYMLRDDATAATVRSIDAGILKEVSVGCAVGKILCSECGVNLKEQSCDHTGAHRILDQPTDAYEWSFVAVPAQPAAGVTKQYTESSPDDKRQEEIQVLLKDREQIMKQMELED